MLDLTITNKNYYEIRLLDGTELHLKRPTQAMVQYTLILKGLADNNKEVETMDAITNLFARILNRNVEGKKYDGKELAEEYDFEVVSYVIGDYFNFWNKEIEEQVNFPQSQQRK